MKKLLALFLAILMLVIPLTSCDLGGFLETPYEGDEEDDDDEKKVTDDKVTNEFGEVIDSESALDETDEWGDLISSDTQYSATQNKEPSRDDTDVIQPGYDGSNIPADSSQILDSDVAESDAEETEIPSGDTNGVLTDNVIEVTNEYNEETFTSPNIYDSITSDPDIVGKSINIIIRNQDSLMREWYKEEVITELDTVIAIRNEDVVKTLDLKEVTYTLMGSSDYEDCLSSFNEAIMDDVAIGFHYYDIAANFAYAGASAPLRDCIANLADIETFPYFDFSLPCWNQSMVSTTMLNNQLYYITGDLNLSTFDKSIAMFVNKNLYADMKSADDPDDIQDVALAGKWDYEELYKWTAVYEDTGDKVVSHDDVYGISAGFGGIPLDALPYAWDLDFIVTEEDGSHTYNIVGNAKIDVAIDKAKALFGGVDNSSRVALANGVGNWNDMSQCSFVGFSEPVAHFAMDRSVFLCHLLNGTEEDNLMIRSMESEFGLLPMPKYDLDQENYGTTAHDSYTLMTVLDHSDSDVKTKGEAISSYLQLSYELTYTNVRSYYADSIVRSKYFGSVPSETLEKSRALFDIIADNVEFNFASVYAPQLNNVLNSCWREVVTENNVDANTAEESFLLERASYESALEEVDSWLGLI